MQRAKTEAEWATHASQYLKAELKRHNVTYDDLAERLKKVGYKKESKASIANKLSRGTFPAPFFLAAMVAIGAETIRLEDV